jgi:hypothetical protein
VVKHQNKTFKIMAWVVTDKNGDKWLFDKKPERSKTGWLNENASIALGEVFPFTELPSFIEQQEWKDAPLQVKISIVKK